MFAFTGTSFGLDTVDKVTQALKANVTNIQETVEKIDENFSSVAKNIGFGREQAFLLKQTLTEGLTEITRLGGTVDNIIKQQEALYKTFGTQITLNKNITDELFATTEATGIEIGTLVDNYARFGKSVVEANSEMAQIMENANLIGVNAKTVTQAVSTNMSALSKFNFKDGVIGLADMAAKSAVLRTDMTKAVSSAEELYKPERAQEFVNTLQRLGATGSSALLDVERVRYMARNEPAKLQEEIAKMSAQFVDETGKMSAIGMDFLKEIQTAAGYGADELANMGVAFSQIQAKQELINKAGLQLTDPVEIEKLNNIMTKGKGGKFEVTFEQNNQQVTKAFEDLSTSEKRALEDYIKKQNEEVKKTFEAKPGEDKSLVKLLENQTDVNAKLTNAIESLATVIPSQIAGSKTGEKIIETIAENTNKLSTTALTKLDELTDDAGKFVDAKIKLIGEVGEQMATKIGPMVDTMEGLSTTIATTLTASITSLSGKFTDLATLMSGVFKLDDFVSLPGNERLLIGGEGEIGTINPKDTIISSTDGPKTEQEVKQMMELLKSPKNSFISQPVETKPILIPETNLGGEKPLTELMIEKTKTTSPEIPKETKTINDVNFNMNVTMDFKNLPNNINTPELKDAVQSTILKPEFMGEVRKVMEKIKGSNFY